MRLWHKDLIQYLPRQQLLGQWRECCLIAKQIAEKGTPNHVLVNRVMEYPDDAFIGYTCKVMVEMYKRGYRCEKNRFVKYIDPNRESSWLNCADKYIFPGWHNDRYLKQCLANLQEKADCGAIPAEEWKRITDRWPEWR